jgi:hypothetical protein
MKFLYAVFVRAAAPSKVSLSRRGDGKVSIVKTRTVF